MGWNVGILYKYNISCPACSVVMAFLLTCILLRHGCLVVRSARVMSDCLMELGKTHKDVCTRLQWLVPEPGGRHRTFYIFGTPVITSCLALVVTGFGRVEIQCHIKAGLVSWSSLQPVLGTSWVFSHLFG